MFNCLFFRKTNKLDNFIKLRISILIIDVDHGNHVKEYSFAFIIDYVWITNIARDRRNG